MRKEKRKVNLVPKIIFEDKVILVLDKPAGLVVNRARSVKGETFQDWLEKNVIANFSSRPLASSGQANRPFFRRSGIVHRLDKETSGLLVVAKTPEAFENLQKQFKERRVEKRYLGLVHGKVIPPEGEISVSISRSHFDRKKFGVFLGGREAKTRYKVIAILASTSRLTSRISPLLLTLLELAPETGRTHQIRVHLKYIGHPVVGDEKYAGRKTARSDRKWCPRQFLHASYLSFAHPETGKKVKFTSPLPRELERVLKIL